MHKREIRGLISAMLLGDGCLSRKYNSHRRGQNPCDLTGVGIFLSVRHGRAQEDYLRWKAAEIDAIFESKGLDRRCNLCWSTARDLGWSTGPALQMTLHWTKYFRHIYRKAYKFKSGSYEKNVEWLLKQLYDPKQLFVWFGDDGCADSQRGCRPSMRLHANGFTFGQAELVRQWFEYYCGVTSAISRWKHPNGRHGPVIRFRVDEAERVWGLIGPYVPEIPSMLYKFRFFVDRYGIPTRGASLNKKR